MKDFYSRPINPEEFAKIVVNDICWYIKYYISTGSYFIPDNINIPEDMNILPETLPRIYLEIRYIHANLERAIIKDQSHLLTKFISHLTEHYTYYGEAKSKAIHQLSLLLKSSLKDEIEVTAAPCMTPYVGKKVSTNNRII